MMVNLFVRRLVGLPFKASFASTKCLSTSAKLMDKARVQHPAPDFKAQAVIDGQFKEIALEDYKGKWLVLFFYPLDFTFVCPTELIAFSDKIQQFKDINCEVNFNARHHPSCFFAYLHTFTSISTSIRGQVTRI